MGAILQEPPSGYRGCESGLGLLAVGAGGGVRDCLWVESGPQSWEGGGKPPTSSDALPRGDRTRVCGPPAWTLTEAPIVVGIVVNLSGHHRHARIKPEGGGGNRKWQFCDSL